MKTKKITTIAVSMLLILILGGCASTKSNNDTISDIIQTADSEDDLIETTNIESNSNENAASILSTVEGSILDTENLFSDRDLDQSADLTEATSIELKSDEDVLINEEGVYLLSGEAEDVTVAVQAADDVKIQIVLDGVTITNEDSPAIYVKSADKVFITSTDSKNYMEVSGSYTTDDETNLDAVIFSQSDLTLNGIGMLEIVSEKGNGVTSKDDLKITGGTYMITAFADGLEANDSIVIYDGEFSINSNKDALHSENSDDTSLGYIYIQNCILNITAVDDAVHGNSIVQIDGGTIDIMTCTEGIEGTYIQINGGVINIKANDDGINAAGKSTYNAAIEVNGGTIYVKMGSGDTDAFDSNGDIYINAGTIDIEAASAFDAVGTAVLNGGKVTVNGEIITIIIQSQMGGGKRR